MIKGKLVIAAFLLFITLTSQILLLYPPNASTVVASDGVIGAGTTLIYTYARISSGTQDKQSGEVAYRLISFNETFLEVEATGNFAVNYTIRYEEGIPIYSERLEGLIYLPPSCINQCLQGNLNWTKDIGTNTLAKVANATAKVETVVYGGYASQVLNLTLALVGMDFGSLSILYNLTTGVMVRELWVPEYGDIIALEFKYLSIAEPQPVDLLRFVPSFAVLAAPTAIALAWLVQRKRHDGVGEVVADGDPKELVGAAGRPPRWTAASALMGATVMTISTFLPWVLVAGQGLFLPNSLSSFISPNQQSVLAAAMGSASFFAHVASVAVWVGIALLFLSDNILYARLVSAVSGLVALYSVWLLLSVGAAPFWGIPVALLGGAIAITGSLLGSVRGISNSA